MEGRMGKGRPPKFNEPLAGISLRIPVSLREYLEGLGSITEAFLACVELRRDLDKGLEPQLADLRVYAALRGRAFEDSRAETLIELAKAGLATWRSKSGAKR